MQRLSFLLLAAVAFGACDDVPTPNGNANGTIDGYVFVSSAVGGVTVTAFAYDAQSGRPGAQLAQSLPTTNDGKFHLELAHYTGPLVLEARGAGAAYLEAATGVSVNWNTGNLLRAVFVKGQLPSLNFTMDAGDASTLVISPFTDLAVNYAEARLAHHRETVFTDSLGKSYALFREHLENDFWSVVPVDLTTGGPRSLDVTVQAGAELAGLSMLVKLTDDELGTQGHSTLQLEELLRRDVVGGSRDQTDGHCLASGVSDVPVFDGCDANGAELALARCPNQMNGCKYTPMTSLSLRRDFSYATGIFLGDARNMSGVQALAMNTLLQDIDARESELFPGPGDHSFDVTPPTISIVATTVADEGIVRADVVSGSDASPWGTVNYGSNQMPPQVTLDGSSNIRFARYATHYTPDSTTSPRWHFLVADNRSLPAAIHLEARLSRNDGTGNYAALTPFAEASSVSGAGYNREVVIDTNYSRVVGLRSGTYKLEYRATDEVGNVTAVQSVQWTQQILPPPVRQRIGAACGAGPNCPTDACLSGQVSSGGCPTRAETIINGTHLIVANGFIDNPNSIPVRVQIAPDGACVKYQVGLIWQHPEVSSSANAQWGCDGFGCHMAPACFAFDTNPEQVVSGAVSTTGIEATLFPYGMLPTCSACGANEIEIPPTSTVLVWFDSDGYHFAFPSAVSSLAPVASIDPVAWPSTPAATGVLGPLWRNSTLSQLHTCQPAEYHQAVHMITRILAMPSVTVSLNARPEAPPQTVGVDDEPLAPAKGTQTSNFVYAPSNWNTAETGYSAFAPFTNLSCGGGG